MQTESAPPGAPQTALAALLPCSRVPAAIAPRRKIAPKVGLEIRIVGLWVENHRLKAHVVPRIPVVGNEHRAKDLRVVAARHRSDIVSRRAGPQHHVFTPLQYPLYANDFPADAAALKRNARNEDLVGFSFVCSRIKCGSVEAHRINPRPFFTLYRFLVGSNSRFESLGRGLKIDSVTETDGKTENSPRILE